MIPQVEVTAIELVPFFKQLEPQMVRWVMDLIDQDTPSSCKPALDALCLNLARRLKECGAEIEILEEPVAGNHLLACWHDGLSLEKPVLLLGHLDTVWDVGESRRRPARLEEGKIYGPGAFDMRGGLALLMALAKFLSQAQAARPVSIFLVSDEETGSHTARSYVEREALKSQLVLVVEPCLPGGALKTARKGVGQLRISAHGVAAHSGVDYEEGASAIEEIAHQIEQLYSMNDLTSGTTINVGTIRGGSRSNVVADFAEIEVDLRVWKMAEGERLASQIRNLRSRNPRVRLEVNGGMYRPPLERSEILISLFQKARNLAREIGVELEEGSVGGGSDGCFAAALGVPTLDGLGPDGAGPHALHEHILLESLVPRAALLTQLVLHLRP